MVKETEKEIVEQVYRWYLIGARYSAKCSTHINSFMYIWDSVYHYPHLTIEETEAQRD